MDPTPQNFQSKFQINPMTMINQQNNNCVQPQLPQEMYPTYNQNQNYYQEFWRVYLQNELLISQMKEFVKDVNNLKTEIQNKSELIEQNQKSQGKKKNRRIDAEIEKIFKCPYPNCGKNYATEVSLNLHIKLKHKGGNKTEREKYARMLLQTQDNDQKNQLIEELNLPPGYLEQIKQNEIIKSQRISGQESVNSQSQPFADSSHYLEESGQKNQTKM